MQPPKGLAMTQSITKTNPSLLTDQLLAGLESRARRYDEQNTFFAEDFQELRNAGYLRLAVPQELGGFGLGLSEVVREQRRLAYHAAPTALAIALADEANVLLIGFARAEGYSVYTHAQRLHPDPPQHRSIAR